MRRQLKAMHEYSRRRQWLSSRIYIALSTAADSERLAARHERMTRLDAGEKPDFLPETREIRESTWSVAPLPADLLDRRVEITGPVDRKMIINALNSGAKVFMADFEDSTTPTWDNLIEGQLNLRDAVRRDDHVRRSRQEAVQAE